MHELSIACSIVETVEENLPNKNARVKTIYLRIGKLSGVVKDALLFSFDIATENTKLEGAKLEIKELPIIIFCDKCNSETELGNPPIFHCKDCGESNANIKQGKEMEIISIEIDDTNT